MSSKKQLIEGAATQLRPHLSKAILRRLEELITELDDAGIANLAAVLNKLYPGKDIDGEQRESTLALFRKFRQTVNTCATDCGIELRIEADSQTQVKPSGRKVWIEVLEAGDTGVSREVDRRQAKETAPEVTPEVRVRGVEFDGKRVVRYFVVWSRANKKDHGALMNERLPLAVGNHRDVKFVLEGEIDIGTDGKWRPGFERKIQDCAFGLVLLSPALLTTRFLDQAIRAATIRSDQLIPVAIEPIAPKLMDLQGLDPERIVRDDHGRAFSQCRNPHDKQAFALAVGLAMGERVPDPHEVDMAEEISKTARRLADDGHCYITRSRGVATVISEEATRRRAARETTNSDTSRSEDALNFLMNWIEDPKSPPYCALLGEYGMGKTTLCKALTREIEQRRAVKSPADGSANSSKLPRPLFFDLRSVGKEAQRGLTLEEILEIVLRHNWKSGPAEATVTAKDILALVKRDGAMVIWDGLDEVLVHIDTHAGKEFTRQLYRLRPPGDEGCSRLLISCRTHYFRTLPEQKAHFRAEDRDNVRAESYRAFVLLPFTEAQIRDYISGTFPNENPDRILETLGAVHNLRELAERPYTLSIIMAHLAEIEQLKADGRNVTGLALYRLMVRSWLTRDDGKHQLEPHDKQELMEDIAAKLWRTGARQWSISEIEKWLDEYLAERPLTAAFYVDKRIDRGLLREDLRTATFLVREGDDKFRFAHASLQEFFLACYLRRALVDGKPERWALPPPSDETVDFLGQALVEDEARERDGAVATLAVIRGQYRAQASELAFSYCLLARRKGYPACSTAGFQLAGADLREIEVAGAPGDLLPLAQADFRGATLRNAVFQYANLEGADFRGTAAERTEFLDCRLVHSVWEDASLEGALFRNSNLSDAAFQLAKCSRTRLINCRPVGTAAGLPGFPKALWAPQSSPSAGSVTAVSGNDASVNSCAWSPDGTRVLSASANRTLRIWDAGTGEVLLRLAGHEGSVLGCAWSPDGTRALSASADSTLRIWDAGTGKGLLRLAGHERSVLGCSWSPDGTRVLSASEDGTLRIWDAGTGEGLLRLAGHERSVLGCSWSPDGTRVLSASEDGTLRIWDAGTGEGLLRLAGHESWVLGCAWSPDGTRVLSGSADQTLRIWDAGTGEGLLRLVGHVDWVRSCSWSPDGTRVLSASDDTMLWIWDAGTGEGLLRLAGHGFWVSGCAWSPDGMCVLSASYDRTLRIWDAGTGEGLLRLGGLEGGVRGCAWSPDGTRVLSASLDRTLRIWDAGTGEVLLRLAGHEDSVFGCAWSPNGTHVVSASADSTLRIWDAGTGEVPLRLAGHEDSVLGCAWSPDGTRVVSASLDRTLRIWDAGTGEVLLRLTGHELGVNSCAWSPDGTRVLSASDDGTLRIWDAGTGEGLLRLAGHADRVLGCAWSPDGTRVLSASSDRTLRIWDAGTGEGLLRLAGHEASVLGCAWSPDGTRVLSASADSTLRIWDAGAGEGLLRLAGHEVGVCGCAWSPDGTRVLSASDDRTLRIWDAATGAELPPTMYHLKAARGQASWATIDHPNNRIVACGPDAWRSIGWIVPDPESGLPIRLPAEAWGLLPVKGK